MEIPQRIFITGIGTDVGKSYATGWLARELNMQGISTITQKFVQTGNKDMSEDIEVHRNIMGIPLQTEDLLHITAPVIYSYPCSPDMAAEIDDCPLNFDVIDRATETLASKYKTVLIEGAGGLMVPLKGEYLTIDYIRERNLPAVLVTNGKLGSVSDTLLALYAIQMQEIELFGVIYNPYFDRDRRIAENSREYMQRYVAKHFPGANWLDMPERL